MGAAVLLVLALCMDSFAACFSCGAGKVRIPFSSALIISGVGTGFLAVSLFLSSLAGGLLPPALCQGLSGGILAVLGLGSLFSSVLKRFLRKCRGQKKLQFQAAGIDCVLSLYLEEQEADLDHSKSLSAREAFLLACALSLDSLVTGFSAGLSLHSVWVRWGTVALCFAFGLLTVSAGGFLGKKLASRGQADLSWVSGMTLLVLALTRFVSL